MKRGKSIKKVCISKKFFHGIRHSFILSETLSKCVAFRFHGFLFDILVTSIYLNFSNLLLQYTTKSLSIWLSRIHVKFLRWSKASFFFVFSKKITIRPKLHSERENSHQKQCKKYFSLSLTETEVVNGEEKS